MLRWLGMWLLRLAPASLPKGRDLAWLCGLPPTIMDSTYMVIGQLERRTVSGEHRRHEALRALLNLGYKERDAALAIELAVRVVT